MHGRLRLNVWACALGLLGAALGCSKHHCDHGAMCEPAGGGGAGGRETPGDGDDDSDDDGDEPGGQSNSDGDLGDGDNGGGRDGSQPPSGSCDALATTREINTRPLDKLDLLFIVDNSGSMAQEQASLREQFPRMIAALTSGDPGNGGPPFSPVKDLHLGVVSTDMGLVGINDIDRCVMLGDDAIMQNQPRLPGCKTSYPRFLTYAAGLNTPQEVANDFACVAMLGTDGCGFEQQLESGLKSLWPGQDQRVTFLGDLNNFGMLGHGDNENQGFLRSDPSQGLSVVAVVLVTDEEDCSSQNTVHFTPNSYLDPNNPEDAKLLMQGLNVRCMFNPQNLYNVQRYVNGFKALRPGNEDMVLFAAIVGVPPETVSSSVLAMTNFGDAGDRERFYDDILSHPSMQQEVETNGTPNDPQDDTMRPSCNTDRGVAYPPRRIVETARGFGANGLVQSICQEDFTPAIDAIVRGIGRQLSNVGCVPEPLERNDDGLVGCSVVWELPRPGTAPPDAPTECDELPFRSAARATGAGGGHRCRVLQLPVKNGKPGTARSGGMTLEDGWYYDDFSDELAQTCSALPQRIAFTAFAQAPTGVTVQLECPPAGKRPSAEECARRAASGNGIQ